MNPKNRKQAEAIREQIVQEAVKLFAKKDIDSVTVLDICKAAGITKPTFYKYISSKEDILLYYYRSAKNTLSESWESMHESDDYVEQLLNAVTVTVETEEQNGPDLLGKYLIYCTKTSQDNSWEEALTWQRTVDAIRSGQENGQIQNTATPHIIARGLQSILLSIRTSWATSKGAFPLVRTCQQQCFHFLRPVSNPV